MVVGALGALGQQRVAAIGDAVDLASRIEAVTKAAAANVLISAATSVKRAQVRMQRRFRVALLGKREYDLYEVAAAHNERVVLDAPATAQKLMTLIRLLVLLVCRSAMTLQLGCGASCSRRWSHAHAYSPQHR